MPSSILIVPPGFSSFGGRLRQDLGLNIGGSNLITDMTFESIDYDFGNVVNFPDLIGIGLKAPVAGIYLVSASIGFGVVGRASVIFLSSGAFEPSSPAQTSEFTSILTIPQITLTVFMRLAVGDLVKCQVQNSAATTSVSGTFGMALVFRT